MFLAEASIQLVPDGTLLLHMLFIAVMVFVLNRTLLKPINQILAEREKQIGGRLSEAQRLSAEAEEKKKNYQAKLREARADGYRLLEKERAAGLKERDEKVRQHREELSQAVAKERESIQKQQEQVRAELEAQADSIGVVVSSQILSRRIQRLDITLAMYYILAAVELRAWMNYPGLEFWKSFNLFVFVAVIIHILRRKISEPLAARRDAIKQELVDAQERRERALAQVAEADTLLGRLDADIQSVHQQAQEEAQSE